MTTNRRKAKTKKAKTDPIHNVPGKRNEVRMAWGKPVRDLAKATGYSSSYLCRCAARNRRPSLEAIHGIMLASGKSYAAVLDVFWPERPKTLKAHTAMVADDKASRGKSKAKPKAKAKRTPKPKVARKPKKSAKAKSADAVAETAAE